MKKIYPLYLALVFIVALSSCKKNNVKPDKGINLTLDALQLQQASADNDFTFNLFQTVAGTNTNNSNLFMSPLSVSMALGMTSNGANGQTLDAIRSTLGFSSYTQDQVNSYFNAIITQLPELDPNTTLKIANSIWYRRGLSVSPAFQQTNTTDYKANVQALDFTNQQASLSTINGWVSDQTSGKITSIINQINANDVMYLLNAIYFKSIWASKFDPSNTKSAAFTLADNSQVQAQFMNGQMNCNSYRSADATLLEMPYSNNKYSMVIVMPAGGKAISDIMAKLNSTTWQSWMSQLSSGSVNLSVPKFQFSSSINLNGALSNMGMGIAFTKAADFTGINPLGGLQITSVDHKAYIDVDETGTTAAAVTSVTIGISAVAENSIVIDHPFIFVIREMKTGLILFAGTVNNPVVGGL